MNTSRRLGSGLPAPTIFDVAREAGVSKSTVSRVLVDSPSVSPEAAAAVHRAMDALGFRANPAARSLRTRRSALVGVLVPSLNEVYGAQAEAVDSVLRTANVGTVISCFGWSVEQCLETMETLVGRGIEGLIVALPDDRDPRILKAVAEAEVPMVLIDREVPGALYDAVLTDQAPGMSQAISHLAECGRRSIGLIAMTARTRPGRTAVAAYANAVVELGIEYRPDWVIQTDEFVAESGFAAAQYLVSAGVDAIAAATPMAALAGVMNYLGEAGLNYPADISLVGFHEHELSLAKRPRLSVITRSVSEIGQIAGQLIIDRLADPTRPAVVRSVNTWFIPGESSDPR